jgi:mannose-6-phosphate isomerase-like protein (cupin superfamily)
MQAAAGASPVMTFGDRHVILFVSSGAGSVTISGRTFKIKATDGVYVRPSEAFQLTNEAGKPLEVFVSACPLAEVAWMEHMPRDFDNTFPQRVVSVDVNQRTAMGPRYFQVLVDKAIGSNVITQFIGHIPQSKASPHRHLYEEAIIVLSGEGCMWTEGGKAAVRAGDVIFLPRKQEHSLQSTTAQGLDVVGVIYPGDNPSINY